MLWEIDIHPAAGEADRAALRVAAAARELGLADNLQRRRGPRLPGAGRTARSSAGRAVGRRN